LVLNKKVRLEKDVSETDKYGRLLRFVYLEDGTFVNLELLKEGYASVMTIPPDVSLSSVFLQAEQQARTAKLGLWSACK
jgi:micrococcal nuclease